MATRPRRTPGPYGIILADPPWPYKVWNKKGEGRSAESHYDTMSMDDIAAVPVQDLAGTDCALFMWVTSPVLPAALNVMSSWGFTYKTIVFVWVKMTRASMQVHRGLGHWTRSNAEYVLLGTRGRAHRVDKGVPQVLITPLLEHSRKPDEIHQRIERLMGPLPRVELFARRRYEGWDVLGNEIDGLDIRESIPRLVKEKTQICTPS